MPSVLVLTDYFLPHLGGGVERSVFELSRRLVQHGCNVTVLTLNTDAAPPFERIEGIDVIRVPGIDLTPVVGIQLALSPTALTAISRTIRDRKIDLIHVHNIFFHLAFVGSISSAISRVPQVTTMHLGRVDRLGGVYGQLASLYERAIGSFILRHSAKIIAVSHGVAQHARQLVAQGLPVVTIPNGVDTRRFSPPGVRPRRSTAKVIFIGRLTPNKGAQFLVKIAPEIFQRHRETEFEIIGDGPMRKQLELQVARRGLRARVHFRGTCDDVEYLLRDADIFVRPSVMEGMPLTVLEAMACGLPVVASRIEGTEELVEEGVTGYLVEPGNHRELFDHICTLLENERLRLEMGRRGRLAIENGYDWDKVAQRTLEVYEEVLAFSKGFGG